MAKYRKKPVVIEAVRFVDTSSNEVEGIDNGAEPEWYRAARTFEADEVGCLRYDSVTSTLTVDTLEGVMIANRGDWIIKGVKGEIYPIKDEIFAATYEAVV